MGSDSLFVEFAWTGDRKFVFLFGVRCPLWVVSGLIAAAQLW